MQKRILRWGLTGARPSEWLVAVMVMGLMATGAWGATGGGTTGSGSGVTYGVSAGSSNQLAMPRPFTAVEAGGWNPIVVKGAGLAAANQTYYQIVTQANTPTFTGLGYAVWTNSANSLCLVLNDSNQVPSVSLSNLWTIQDMAGNYKYDLFGAASSANTPLVGSNPFGTWEVSGLGGSAGTGPAPDVGTVPNLVAVTRSMPSRGVLTLSPGFYDIGQYTWFPTNLTVVAHGAFISSLNIIEGIHPYGTFSMYGGGFSNAANYYTVGPSQNGSAMLRLTDCQSNILFDSVNLFACTDGPTGALQDNTSLTFRNCIGGTLWDFATLSAVGGATNTSVNFLGCRLWSKTNGLATANVFITPSTVNQVRVVGCLLQAGPGFITGAGILQAAANTTIEVSGTVINLSPQANGASFKIKQTAGTMIVPSGDFNLSDVNGTITWKEPLTVARVTGSDATTTGQALVDATGLSVALGTSGTYEFEAVLSVTTTAVTTGTKYGVQYSAAGAAVEAQIVGSLTTTASASERISALNTATSNAYLTTSGQTGQVFIRGIVTTGANAGNLTIQHLKVTSGTSTVKVNSFLKVKRIS